MDIKSLIPVNYNNDEITVLGRDLHAALEVKSRYNDWIKNMIAYGFEEGVDYVKFFTKKTKNLSDENSVEELNLHFSKIESNQLSAGRPEENHQLKLDMAKEIAMIQRSEAGRKIRKYFIEVEKQYRKKLSNRSDLNLPFTDITALAIDSASQRARAFSTLHGVREGIAIAHAFNEVEKEFKVDLSGWKNLIPAAETPPVDYTPTQIAEKLSNGTNCTFTARQINSHLKKLGFQYKDRNGWKLTELGKRYGVAYPYERHGHTGFQIRWKPEVIDIIEDEYFDF